MSSGDSDMDTTNPSEGQSSSDWANRQRWCLICGRYENVHEGICTADIGVQDLMELIKRDGVKPGQPLNFPRTADVVAFTATDYRVELEVVMSNNRDTEVETTAEQ